MVKLRQGDEKVTVEEETPIRSAVTRIVWFLTHVLAGVAVFTAVLWIRPDVFQTRDEHEPARLPLRPLEPATPPSLVPVATVDSEPADQLDRADRLLQSGSYTMAMQIYNELAVGMPDAGDASLTLRRALCSELVGDLDQAFALYQSLMENEQFRSSTAAAQLGQARIWHRRGKPGPTRSLLYSLALSAANDEAVAATAFHLLASLSVQDAFEPEPDLVKEHAVITPDPLSRIGWLLDSLELRDTPDNAVHDGETETVEQFGSDLSEIRLGLRKNSANLGSLVQGLSRKANLSLKQSAAARRVLDARTVHVNVRDVDFATWFDAVLDPIGLVWDQSDNVIHIRLATEVTRRELTELRRRQAQRHCQGALTLYPEHPLAVTTFLVLGNIRFWDGDYTGAANSYHEIVRRASDTSILRTAWFNLSRAAIQTNDFESARQAIYKFVDLSRGHASESIGYLFLGRQFLDDGQPENATRQFVRAIAVARDNEIKRLAAESLATAYLISNNPVAANTTLMDHRDILRVEPFESKSAFLSALARFRAATHQRDQQRTGRSLASAVAHADANRFFCSAAHLLVGEAYEELGLPNQTEAVFSAALRDARPHDIRDQMMFKLGKHYVEDGKLDEGRNLMQQLVDSDHEPWSRRARFFLAKLALQRREFEDCLRRCEEILELQLTVEDKSTVLTLMGRVYEMKSDHYKAALCFAGLLPMATAEPSDLLDSVTD